MGSTHIGLIKLKNHKYHDTNIVTDCEKYIFYYLLQKKNSHL